MGLSESGRNIGQVRAPEVDKQIIDFLGDTGGSPVASLDPEQGSLVIHEKPPKLKIDTIPMVIFLQNSPKYSDDFDASTALVEEAKAVRNPHIPTIRRPLSNMRKTVTAVSMALLG